MKNLSHYFFLLEVMILASYSGISQNPHHISHALYHKYGGHYYFDDSTYITGGLMDEGDGGLVFIEPMNGKRGGIFRPESKTEFISISFFNNIPNGYYQIEFDMNKEDEVTGLWWKEKGKKPVCAVKKKYYSIENIQFKNGDITLAGELFLPETKGPHPLIINVHGSGPQTRHLGPWNTVFSKYGVAVLCYDKRGVGESTGYFGSSGYPDFASDVVAAIEFAQQRPDIHPHKIGLHGSSEGGWVSSIATSMSDDIAFMIIRAGSGVSGAETYIHEIKNELPREDLTDPEFVQAIRFERKIQEMASEKKSLAEVNAYIRETREKNTWFSKAFGDYKEMNPDYWEKMKKSDHIDPVVHLRKVSDIPVLWFLAQKDENVPYKLSKPRLEVAFEEAGNEDFELVTIPNANHSFLYYTPEGKLEYADGYWDKMISWLIAHDIAKN